MTSERILVVDLEHMKALSEEGYKAGMWMRQLLDAVIEDVPEKLPYGVKFGEPATGAQ